jgi:hypothetical protein
MILYKDKIRIYLSSIHIEMEELSIGELSFTSEETKDRFKRDYEKKLRELLIV